MSDDKKWDGVERRQFPDRRAVAQDARTVTLHAIPPDADEILRQLFQAGVDVKISTDRTRSPHVQISFSFVRTVHVQADGILDGLKEVQEFVRRAFDRDDRAEDVDTDRVRTKEIGK